MKIYNVIRQDRHTDTTATPFIALNEAIKYAKDIAVKEANQTGHYEEEVFDAWVFFVEYNPEGDCLWITEHEI